MNLYPNFGFEILKTLEGTKSILRSSLSSPRLGKVTTPHGTIETPAFIFCGTKASIKNIPPRDVLEMKTQVILANTYHLLLNGGADVAQASGGIHKLMNWPRPILTDSGGFQIFSFGHGLISEEIKGAQLRHKDSLLVSITEEGATLRSYIDGSKWLLTPELSIATQQKIGADLIVAFDECTAFNAEAKYTEASMHRSHRWEARSLEYFRNNNSHTQALYGVVQGGIYENLREISADFVNQNDFFGICIGGSLGKNKPQMYSVVDYTASRLVKNRPIHLLGIGGISDIFHGVECGIDTFDCVHPTRIARHGCAILSSRAIKALDLIIPEDKEKREFISLKNSSFKNKFQPLDFECLCYACKNFSTAYLHYLIKAKENLFMYLLGLHNIYQMNKLMSDIRKGIEKNSLIEAYKNWCGF